MGISQTTVTWMIKHWRKSFFFFSTDITCCIMCVPKIMKGHISIVKEESVFLFLEVSLWLCGLKSPQIVYSPVKCHIWWFVLIHLYTISSCRSGLMASKLQPLSTVWINHCWVLCVLHLLSRFETNYVAFSDRAQGYLASFINQKPSDHGLTLSCIYTGDEKLHVNWKDIIHIHSIPKIVLNYLREMCSSLSVCGWKIPPGPQKQHICHRRNH